MLTDNKFKGKYTIQSPAAAAAEEGRPPLAGSSSMGAGKLHKLARI